MSDRVFTEFLEGRRLFAAAVNDTQYAAQTDLQAINITKAWSQTTGSLNVVVADLDTGIDYVNPDLVKNIWINQAEIPGYYVKHLKDTDQDGRISFYDLNSRRNARWMTDANGNGYIDAGDLLRGTKKGGWEDAVDADANGYTDDIIGWDFADGDNDPYDFVGHGSHTAGTIAATQDNAYGVAGIATTSLMVVKIFDDEGNGGTEDQIAEAIRYSADNGARVSNNSWGYTQPTFGGGRFPFFGQTTADYSDEPIYQAIQYAGEKGQLFIAAAGNDAENNDFSFAGSFPATYDLANIVSVAAIDDSGALTYFSNYGENSVDIAAPGVNILSTWTGADDGATLYTASGTSMATPHVTGTVALMLARYPKLTAAQIKTYLLGSVNVNSSVYGELVSGGTLNAGAAVHRAAVARSQANGTYSVASANTASGVKAAVFSTMPITTEENILDETYLI